MIETVITVSPRLTLVVRPLGTTESNGLCWEYIVLADGVWVVWENDLVTWGLDAEGASRQAAGLLLADLASGEKVWAEQTRAALETVRADLESWGGVVRGKR